MARFEGRQGKGAMRKLREKKTIEGEIRNEEYQARKKAADARKNAADEMTRMYEELSDGE